MGCGAIEAQLEALCDLSWSEKARSLIRRTRETASVGCLKTRKAAFAGSSSLERFLRSDVPQRKVFNFLDGHVLDTLHAEMSVRGEPRPLATCQRGRLTIFLHIHSTISLILCLTYGL